MKPFLLPGRLCSTADIRRMAAEADGPYTLIYLKPDIEWVAYAQERMVQIMRDTQAVMAYSDRFNKVVSADGSFTATPAPVIDYQIGALRDDFDFGSVLLIRTDALLSAVQCMDTEYQYAGWYDLRLRLAGVKADAFVHINEYLYYDVEQDTRKSGEKLFDYVDPRNRGVQIEMEQCVTAYLKAVKGYLSPDSFRDVDLSQGEFEYEASVVIPCKNRVKTIGDAIRSALSQQVRAPYKYNVIVVDDNSTDGTVDVIQDILREQSSSAHSQSSLIYIAQDKTWHAIGGNWNAAFHHPQCGRFAIQLDSDDMYADPTVVQQFIDAFHEQNCAMVVGTYQLTDFEGHPLPPGVIDHREWTPDNGRNNALRINGLGAPRAFWTPLLREINFPTTKYGEDYAVGLRISREYRIGRIYNVLYNCRRWDDNSDANCDIEAMNRNNLYKDRIRTWELMARIAANR